MRGEKREDSVRVGVLCVCVYVCKLVTAPAWSLYGGRCVFVVLPNPLLLFLLPQPLGEREFYTLTLNHSRPLNRGRSHVLSRAHFSPEQRNDPVKLIVFAVTLLFAGIID